MPLIACLTATLLSCYSGETDRSRVHMPTPPSHFEFYPQYDDDIFASRIGPQYDHDSFTSRIGEDAPEEQKIAAAAYAGQLAVIYSDEPIETVPTQRPEPGKPGKDRKVADDGDGKPGKAPDVKRVKRTKVVIERDVELAYAEPETKRGWLASLFNSGVETSVPKVKGIDTSKEGYREVIKAAREHGVPVDLALRVARQESGGNCSVTSSAGAGGVMQVMPKTAAKHGVTRFKNIYDCRTGAQTGVRELKHLLELSDGDVKQTLIGYNCGERCMNGKRKKLPAETVNYVASITAK